MDRIPVTLRWREMEALAARSKVIWNGSAFLEQAWEGQKQGLGSLNCHRRRRKYSTMKAWESDDEGENQPIARRAERSQGDLAKDKFQRLNIGR